MESLGAFAVDWHSALSRIWGAGIVRLSVLGVASLALYVFGLTVRYPLQAGLQDPRATWVTLVVTPPSAFVIHLATYVCVTLFYVLACWNLWHAQSRAAGTKARKRVVLVIVAVWLLASGALMGVAPGGESHDAFDYLFRSRMWVEYGGNPLAEVPRQYNTAPFYKYVAWHSHVDTYGPIWGLYKHCCHQPPL